jgi:hypothetical protein
MRTILKVGLFVAACFGGSAQACDYWRDQAGMIRGTCKLEQSTDGRFLLDLDLEMTEVRPPRYRLKLPNLQIRRMRYSMVGTSDFELFADVRNVDAGNAPSAPIVTEVDILFAGAITSAGSFRPRTVVVPPIPANSEVRVSFGVFPLPDRKLDWDVAVMATVDPPTSMQPAAAVFESNETDNAFTDLCRIFGAVGNQVGPRACL